jgi:hypothetical protein
MVTVYIFNSIWICKGKLFKVIMLPLNQCRGTVTIYYNSGSADF